MSGLMLLGVLRAPTPEPDNILGIAQLADRARQAADEIERLTAENKHLRTDIQTANDAWDAASIENERLQARVKVLGGALRRIERGTADYWALVRIAGTALAGTEQGKGNE